MVAVAVILGGSQLVHAQNADINKGVAFWCGKVNQHVSGGEWTTDSDGISGCPSKSAHADSKLSYCQKFYPSTTSVEPAGPERIYFYSRNNGEPSNYSTKQTYRCVNSQSSNDDPTARFSMDPNPVAEGNTFTLDASGSSDTEDNNNQLTYQWDFASDDFPGQNETGQIVSNSINNFPSDGRRAMTLTVEDTDGATDTTTRYIREKAANSDPTASNDSYATEENTTLREYGSGVLGNDSDPDNDNLSAELVSDVSNGRLSLDSDGSFRYNPRRPGDDSFTYRVSDGDGGSDTATVSISVSGDSTADIDKGVAFWCGKVSQHVSGGEWVTDPDGISGCPSKSRHADSKLSYCQKWYPETDTVRRAGVERIFFYSRNNDEPSSYSNKMTYQCVSSQSSNDDPNAYNDSYSVDEGSNLREWGFGVLSNDSDPDGDTLEASLVSGPASGRVNLDADGSFAYKTGRPGEYSFTYRVSDGNGGTDQATVNISVTGSNRAPNATDDSYQMTMNWFLIGLNDGSIPNNHNILAENLLVNDSDPDNDSLRATVVAPPKNGTVSMFGGGVFVYAMNTYGRANYSSITDSFRYRVNDGNGGTDTARVTINITNTNSAPNASDDSYSTDENTNIDESSPGVLGNDNDSDGDSLDASLVSENTNNGSLDFDPDGSFTYYPSSAGSDSFTYEAKDGNGGTDQATVDISVTKSDVSASLQATPDEVDQGDSATLTVSSRNANSCSWTQGLSGSAPTNGNTSVSPNSDTAYEVECSNTKRDATDSATVTVNQTQPTANDDTYNITENDSLTGNVLTNDDDPLGQGLTAIYGSRDIDNGNLSTDIDGNFSYDPSAAGTDTFAYQAVDKNGNQSAPATVTISVASSGADIDKGVAFWCGKVNQHVSGGQWTTDSDGISGCPRYSRHTDSKLSYCRKFYPNTDTVRAAGQETITNWQNRGNNGSFTATKQTYRCLDVNEKPNAQLNGSPDPVKITETVTWSAFGSSDSDGEITSFAWDTNGDGSFGDHRNTDTYRASYSSTGNETVSVRVTDNDGVKNTDGDTVTVKATPSVDLSASPERIDEGNATELEWSTTNVDNCDWTDGLSVNGIGTDGGSKETINTPGTYRYEVSCSGRYGSASDDVDVTVDDVNEAPNAVINAVSSALIGQDVRFDGTSSNDPEGDSLTYQWSNSDQSVDISNPNDEQTDINFSSSGNYEIDLEVDDGDKSDLSSKTINISSPSFELKPDVQDIWTVSDTPNVRSTVAQINVNDVGNLPGVSIDEISWYASGESIDSSWVEFPNEDTLDTFDNTLEVVVQPQDSSLPPGETEITITGKASVEGDLVEANTTLILHAQNITES
jgi:hypothetical protein